MPKFKTFIYNYLKILNIWIITTFCFIIVGFWIFLTGRFMNWTLLVYCQTSYGLWLSSPICTVFYLYIGVIELNCITSYLLVYKLSQNYGAQNQPIEKLLHLLFLGKCGYICVTLDIFYFSLWGALRFLYFLQGFAPKLLNWSHPCIHWQPNWLKIPVGSSKLWFECSYS